MNFASKYRYEYIDLLKGFCIVLVVFGHAIEAPQGEILSKSSIFRMPLYFFLSGLFFSKYNSFATFLTKRTNNLLVPFIFFCGISLIYQLFACSIKENFHNLAPENVFSENLTIDTPIWFLISLFEVSLFYYTLSRITNLYLRSTLILLLSSLSFYSGQEGITLPIYIDSSLTGLTFFHVGYIIRQKATTIFTKNKFDYIIIIATLSLFVFLQQYIKGASMISNEYDANFFIYLTCALSAILCLFYFCKQINRLPILNKLGRYSIVILGLHMHLLGIYRFIFHENKTMVYIVIGFTLLTLYFTIDILVKYTPQFIAQKQLLEPRRVKIYLNFYFRKLPISFAKI